MQSTANAGLASRAAASKRPYRTPSRMKPRIGFPHPEPQPKSSLYFPNLEAGSGLKER